MARPARTTALTCAPACGTAKSLLPLLGAFAALLLITRPAYLGDTVWYAQDINRALHHQWLHSPQIWNFAHLLLRPFGILLSSLFLRPASALFSGDRQAGITLLLVLPNVISAFVCAALVQKMTFCLTCNRAAAAIAAIAFLCSSVVLNYSRSGSSYLPGLACSAAALYWAGFSPDRSWRAAAKSGVFAALSALLWLPYLASFPAILLAGPVLDRGAGKQRGHVAFGILFSITAGLTLLIAYGAAAIAIHATGWDALVGWIRASDLQLRDRKLLRMVTGFARSLYETGHDSVWLKWYLFRDPYAGVGLTEILRAAFWKPAAFYASLAGLAFLLWTSRAGRLLLLLAGVAAAPHIAMALLFESGSPERYLGILPLAFVGFGYAMANRERGRKPQIIAAILCCAHIPANLAALSTPAVDRAAESGAVRAAAVAPLKPASRVWVINNFDDLFVLRASYPFHPINRMALPEVVPIVPVGPRVPFWRDDFACAVLSTWTRGGELWVTKRVLSERPAREWLWVEGDDRRLTWQAIHSYFMTLNHGVERGGDDGFFLIPDDVNSRIRMAARHPCPPEPASP